MTIERPMFPPRLDNPFRLVGGVDVTEQKIAPGPQQEEPEPRYDYGAQDDLRRYIKRFEEARARYYQALAWTAAAEAGEIPGADVETAKQENVLHHQDMMEAGRHLILAGPAEPKAMVDWCLYMEKHFSLLPQELMGQSLSLHLLKIVRLSLRKIAKYGKRGPQS